jgi:hypothetical protein
MTTVHDLLVRMRADAVIARVWAQGKRHLQALACHLCWIVPEAGHGLSGVVSIVPLSHPALYEDYIRYIGLHLREDTE